MEENTNPERTLLEDNSAMLRFFEGVLNRAAAFVKHFDAQTNILIGIDVAVVGFSISGISKGENVLTFSVLAIFGVLSVFCALYAIHPPKFMRKKGQEESLFYNKKICSFKSSKEYSESVKEMLLNKDMLIEGYSTEIYNIYKYFYRPKRKLFKISRDLLLFGIVFGLLIYLITHFV